MWNTTKHPGRGSAESLCLTRVCHYRLAAHQGTNLIFGEHPSAGRAGTPKMAGPAEGSARPRHAPAVSRHCISRGRGAARGGGAGRGVTAPAANGRWRPAEGRGGAERALRRGRRSGARGGGGRAGTARGAWGALAAGFGFRGPAGTRGHRGEGHGEGRAGGWRCAGRAPCGPAGDAGRRCRTPLCPQPSSGTAERV